MADADTFGEDTEADEADSWRAGRGTIELSTVAVVAAAGVGEVPDIAALAAANNPSAMPVPAGS